MDKLSFLLYYMQEREKLQHIDKKIIALEFMNRVNLFYIVVNTCIQVATFLRR